MSRHHVGDIHRGRPSGHLILHIRFGLDLLLDVMAKNAHEIVENENTPWKINMQPKNGGLEHDFPF